MPIYLYQCENCNETREYFLEVGRKPSRCMECDARGKLKRTYDGQTLSMQLDRERNWADRSGKLESAPFLAIIGQKSATLIRLG